MYKLCAGDIVESESSVVLALLEVAVYWEQTHTKQRQTEMHAGLQTEKSAIKVMYNFLGKPLPHWPHSFKAHFHRVALIHNLGVWSAVSVLSDYS